MKNLSLSKALLKTVDFSLWSQIHNFCFFLSNALLLFYEQLEICTLD